jgi:hypothetical protein
MLDDARYRVTCRSGATIDWLRTELAARHRRQHSQQHSQQQQQQQQPSIASISTTPPLTNSIGANGGDSGLAGSGSSTGSREIVVDALLTADGSFLDPLDCVADVCEPDEVLIGVVSSALRPNSPLGML